MVKCLRVLTGMESKTKSNVPPAICTQRCGAAGSLVGSELVPLQF